MKDLRRLPSNLYFCLLDFFFCTPTCTKSCPKPPSVAFSLGFFSLKTPRHTCGRLAVLSGEQAEAINRLCSLPEGQENHPVWSRRSSESSKNPTKLMFSSFQQPLLFIFLCVRLCWSNISGNFAAHWCFSWVHWLNGPFVIPMKSFVRLRLFPLIRASRHEGVLFRYATICRWHTVDRKAK